MYKILNAGARRKDDYGRDSCCLRRRPARPHPRKRRRLGRRRASGVAEGKRAEASSVSAGPPSGANEQVSTSPLQQRLIPWNSVSINHFYYTRSLDFSQVSGLKIFYIRSGLNTMQQNRLFLWGDQELRKFIRGCFDRKGFNLETVWDRRAFNFNSIGCSHAI